MLGAGAGFVPGANLPWVRYGGDFGANAWRPEGGLACDAPPHVASTLAAASAAGAAVVRWFLFCDGRAGIVFDHRGVPCGLDDRVAVDLDAAIDLVRAARLRVVFSLIDFLWCAHSRRVNGVRLGGHRRTIADPRMRDALLDRVLDPVLARYGRDDTIAAWEVINEPEWATFGFDARNPFTSVGAGAMRAFIGDAARLVHARTSHAVTVGSAHPRGLRLVQGLDLDFYQVHWYDRLDRRTPLATPVSSFGLDKPVVLGEFPTRGSTRDPAAIVAIAREAGYAGAWPWSLVADDGATNVAAALSVLQVRSGGPEGPPNAGPKGPALRV